MKVARETRRPPKRKWGLGVPETGRRTEIGVRDRKAVTPNHSAQDRARSHAPLPTSRTFPAPLPPTFSFRPRGSEPHPHPDGGSPASDPQPPLPPRA